MVAVASSKDTDSGMKRRRQIFIRSQWHFLGSLVIPVREASGSSLNSEGTGPAMMSPSNKVESAFQDWRSMVGRLLLNKNKDSLLEYNELVFKLFFTISFLYNDDRKGYINLITLLHIT